MRSCRLKMTPSRGSAVPAGDPEPLGFPLKLSRPLRGPRTGQQGTRNTASPAPSHPESPQDSHRYTCLTEWETEAQG